jgi:RNA polymerase sigma-70 factor (ECF subfamily)
VAIDFLKRRRLPCVPLDAEVESAARAPVPHASTIELPPGLLSPREKLVLHLLFDEDWETQEIADLLGIAPQSVRNHKHRALKRLRKFLKKREGRDV